MLVKILTQQDKVGTVQWIICWNLKCDEKYTQAAPARSFSAARIWVFFSITFDPSTPLFPPTPLSWNSVVVSPLEKAWTVCRRHRVMRPESYSTYLQSLYNLEPASPDQQSPLKSRLMWSMLLLPSLCVRVLYFSPAQPGHGHMAADRKQSSLSIDMSIHI